MKLKLQNAKQHHIADLMWAAKTDEDVNTLLQTYGRDARIVYELMIAATFDEVKDTDIAEDILKDIMTK